LGQNADPLNIQASEESGPENQMTLNVVESNSIQSLLNIEIENLP
jgi:hypothetical protein